MSSLDAGRRYVIPGDIIADGSYSPGQNTVLVDGNVVATAVGLSEVGGDEGAARVLSLAGRYYPKINDLVVGKIASHTSLSWELDINSSYVGFLPAQDVFGRDFSAFADELGSKLVKGDLVAARIANFDRTRDPLVTIGDRDLGKIDSGELVTMPPSKIPRLIGKGGAMIQAIEEATGAGITIGQNGWVVVTGDEGNPDGLSRAKKAIRMIDGQAHLADLTDRVAEMLKSGGGDA